MKRTFTVIITAMILGLIFTMCALPVFATEEAIPAEAEKTVTEAVSSEATVTSVKAVSASAAVAVAAAVGAVAMAMVIKKAIDGIARQPEAEGKIKTNLMLGLVFVETTIIYALIVAIFVIFVL